MASVEVDGVGPSEAVRLDFEDVGLAARRDVREDIRRAVGSTERLRRDRPTSASGSWSWSQLPTSTEPSAGLSCRWSMLTLSLSTLILKKKLAPPSWKNAKCFQPAAQWWYQTFWQSRGGMPPADVGTDSDAEARDSPDVGVVAEHVLAAHRAEVGPPVVNPLVGVLRANAEDVRRRDREVVGQLEEAEDVRRPGDTSSRSGRCRGRTSRGCPTVRRRGRPSSRRTSRTSAIRVSA